MFKGGQPNPYDDVVAKTTDENLTGEDWGLILNLCDKVQDDGESGARNIIAAVLKRLAHRNPNVQLYTLTLAEALSKNCTITLHREIASRAFTQGLEKIITDRTTHERVRQRALGLIEMWTGEFEHDPSLGVMEDCYNSLKAKSYKFEAPTEPPPPEVDDDVRRKEEEELQRVLELSVQDKGGRSQWEGYSLASSSGASGSGSGLSGPSATAASPPSRQAYNAPPASSGYVPTSSVPPQAYASTPAARAETPSETSVVAKSQEQPDTPAPVSPQNTTSAAPVSRVRALHTFEPTEPGELAFDKGDIIKVVDRGYKDWWRGQLKGRTGIFPVNYVEAMPEPTATELAREAEQEASVFSQAVDVDRLLTMLRSMDPSKDNLADNEEIQELYRACMTLRPKIVKLIEKYSQKRADLVSMNESFLKARTIFDSMMEESLARHTQMYGSDYARPSIQQGRSQPVPGPQAYGWNPNVYEQPGYNAYPAPAVAYQPSPGPEVYNGQPQNLYSQQVQPQQQPASSTYQQPQAQSQQQPLNTQQPPAGFPDQVPAPYNAYPAQFYGQQPTGYGGPPPSQTQHIQHGELQPQGGSQTQGGHPVISQQLPHDAQIHGVSSQPHESPQLQPQATQQQTQAHDYPQHQAQPHVQSQAHDYPQHQTQHVQSQTQPQPQPQAQPQPKLQPQPQLQAQAQPQIQVQPQAQLQPQTQVPQQAKAQPQAEAQPQVQPQTQESLQIQQSGPPYMYDPNTRYSDSNVQAWAQYYAQGGKDPTGAVYFISVPGVKEPASTSIQEWSETLTNVRASAIRRASDGQVTEGVEQQDQQRPQQAASPDLIRRQSLGTSVYNSRGGTYPNRQPTVQRTTVHNGSFDEELKNPYDDDTLSNPYDAYRPGAGGGSTSGYGMSPYNGLATDMSGMNIGGAVDMQSRGSGGYGGKVNEQAIVGQ